MVGRSSRDGSRAGRPVSGLMDGGSAVGVAGCVGCAGMDVSVALVVVSPGFVPVLLFGAQLLMRKSRVMKTAVMRLKIFKSMFDSFVGVCQRFWQHARLSNGRHKICITVPARDDM